MKDESTLSTLERARSRLNEIVAQENLADADVSVLVKPLTPQEAIGNPQRQDYPIIVGKERMIEAQVHDARGHAFTDMPQTFRGTVGQLLSLPLDTNAHRAIFVATLNATLKQLNRVSGTIHCKDEDPESCGKEIAGSLKKRPGIVDVGLIGLNPAIAQRLVETFGPDHVHITDRNADNIGGQRFGVQIWDSAQVARLIEASDLLLVTGTTLVNETFDEIYRQAQAAQKQLLLYGVTAAGVCELLNLERICPFGRDQ